MAASARLRPYPWFALARLTRGEVGLLHRARSWATGWVRLDAVAAAVEGLVGARVEMLVRRAEPFRPGAGWTDGVGVLLARSDDPDSPVLLEAEASLANALVARAIRRPAPRLLVSGDAPSPALAGAFAAVVAAAARRAHANCSLRVIAAGASSALVGGVAGGAAGALISVSLTVVIDDDAYAARAVLPASTLGPPVPWDRPWDRRSLRALGAMPLAMALVAGAGQTTVAGAAALQRGDVFLPGDWYVRWQRAGGDAMALVGDAALAAPGADVGVRVSLAREGHVVFGGELVALGQVGQGPLEGMERTMSGSDDSAREREQDGEGAALLEAVGDVQVVVHVEIGQASMAARDWAALGRGDVIALGRRVGELVMLRVGGVPIARGELVEIEGELGVRIAERIVEEPTRG